MDLSQEEFLELRKDVLDLDFWKKRLKLWITRNQQRVTEALLKKKYVLYYRGGYHWENVTIFEYKRNRIKINELIEIDTRFKTADDLLKIFENLTINLTVWRELLPPYNVKVGTNDTTTHNQGQSRQS